MFAWCEAVAGSEGGTLRLSYLQTKIVEKPLLSGRGEALHEMLETQFAAVLKCGAPESPRNWYAVYTRPSHERRAAKSFEFHRLENFMPCYRVVRRWKNRCTKTLEIPLFPGYLFVKIAAAERVRVLEVPGVVSIIGKGREPMPLPAFEIESLRAGLHLRQAEPHPYLVVGQRARIRNGALAGMEGVMVRKKNGLRVVLTLDLIMQSVAVEVDGEDLEPAARSLVSAGRV